MEVLFDVHGGWVKDIEGVKEWFDAMLRTRLYPCLRALFPDAAGDGSSLRVQSAYLFKYTAETGAATDVHVDSGLLSFTIALNEPDQYEGEARGSNPLIDSWWRCPKDM